jgi:hypothetical protein
MLGENSTRKELYTKSLLTVAIILVIIFRCHTLVWQPRFWAEEGATFFAFAFGNGFLENLFTAHYGYITLYNSLATSFAALFSLETAPLVTTWTALVVQTCASAFLIWGHYRLLPCLWQRAGVALLMQLLAYTGNWLNTIGVQFFLACVTFFILMYDEEKRSASVKLFHGCILVLNGLTGVLSCFMIPAFLYKYLKTKTKSLAIYTGILSTSLILQGFVFIAALLRHDPEVAFRLVKSDPVNLFIKLVSFQFSAPFFGHLLLTTPKMEDFGFEIRKVIFNLSGFDNFRTESQVITFLVGSIVLLLLLVLFIKARKNLDVKCIIVLLMVIIPMSTLFSVQMSSGPRYTYVPSIVMVFFLVSLLKNWELTRFAHSIACLLLLFSLILNSLEYQRSVAETAYSKDWLPWKDEVRKWRQYNNYDLAIWPPPWRMSLKKDKNEL